jgi:hypothetical protein
LSTKRARNPKGKSDLTDREATDDPIESDREDFVFDDLKADADVGLLSKAGHLGPIPPIPNDDRLVGSGGNEVALIDLDGADPVTAEARVIRGVWV